MRELFPSLNIIWWHSLSAVDSLIYMTQQVAQRNIQEPPLSSVEPPPHVVFYPVLTPKHVG